LISYHVRAIALSTLFFTHFLEINRDKNSAGEKNLPKIADKLFISDYPQIIAGISCFVEKQMEQ